MPRNAVGAFIGAAVIIVVMLFAVGAFDTQARSSRIMSGGCDVPDQNIADLVSLTTESNVPNGYYDSLDSPSGTPYTVPARHDFILCHLESVSTSATSTVVQIGYADSAVSATSTAPATPVTLANVASPAVDERLNVSTYLGTVPAGKVPWVRHTPSVAWSAHVVGVLRRVED